MSEYNLPTHFLNDADHRQMNKPNFDADHVAAASFPADFPYEFNLFGTSDSAKSNDEGDFFAALTRDLARSLLCEPGKLAAVPKFNALDKIENPGVALPLSPQSTLGGIGSWSGKSEGSSNGSSKGTSQATSPRASTAPFAVAEKKDSWDLMYETSGDVSGWKIGGDGPSQPLTNYQHGRGLIDPRDHLQSDVSSGNPSSMFRTNDPLSRRIQYEQLKHEILMKQHLKLCAAKEELFCQQRKQFQQQYRNTQNRGEMCGGGAVRPLGLPQSAWPQLPSQQQQQHNNISGVRGTGFHGGSGGVKKECTGTGVFLPRQYNKPTETRKKLGCSTALLPARVVQALNLNFEDLNAFTQPRFHGGFASDHDALFARRNALLTQQKRSFSPEAALNHEISLPQEWTY